MLVRSRMHGGGESLGKAPGIVDVKIGSVVIPTDAQGRFWIHHTGPDPRRTIPAWKVLRGRFKPADLAGKIVFVGSSASALNDLRASPLHSATAGVEFHAQVAEQILNHEFLSRPEWAEGAEIAIAFVAGVLVVLIVYRVGAAWGGLVAMTMVVGGSISSWLLFKEHGLLTAPLFPALTTGGVFLMASMTSYLRSEASRREVKSVFGRYISPVVLERLAANPGHIQLGGELRDMSVLFCDIRGFTALSEQMDAKSLTAFVNAFLTPMTSAIHSNEGTVDKYLGDAVMAFWNAPVDDSRHALHACRASLAMCAELVRFNEQRAVASNLGAEGGYRDPIRVGIGIGTGMCCVGNMGSRQRFDYSVVGDTVNLASRLEGLTKTYGVAIVISEETRAEAQGLAALELDVTRVKGKSRAVRIYALLGDEGLATDPSFRELASVHANMLEACREGEWMRAQECVDRLRSMDMARELDLLTLYELYQARVEGLGQQDVERTQAV
ncbi:MAG TPA: adenylate/guanylate cyclase domain-containing protein, partial [Woeseiaceae bacterium]|nr:adenylate/guanylate cyclase domain-containing protein [Woeseiaceae bacterium]